MEDLDDLKDLIGDERKKDDFSFQKVFDIVASGLGLILLSPLFLVLAIWIKADSKGPVFYRQVRVGRYNRDFRIFKFRSMRAGSDTGSLITIGGATLA